LSFLKKLLYLLSRKQKKQLLILVFLMLIGMIFEMLGLGVLIPSLAVIVNSDIGASYPSLKPFLNSIGNPPQEKLVIYGMVTLVIIYIIKSFFLVYLSWRQSKFSAELSSDLSQRLFSGYLKQPYIFHLQRNSALLIRNIQGEVNQFTEVSRAVINVSIEISALLGVAAILVIAEPVGAAVVTVFLSLLAYAFQYFTKKKLMVWGKHRQLHDGAMNQHLMQGLSGVKDVKLMNREDYFVSRFRVHSAENAKIFTKQYALKQIPRMYLELLAVIALTCIIIVFILQNKPLSLLIPTIGIFMAAAFRMIPCFYRIMGANQQIRYAQPVVDVLYNEFVTTNSVNVLPETSVHPIPFNNLIRVSGIFFQYPGTQSSVLRDISMTIKKGESIGFIGQSGSGKTTFINLITGLLQPQEGTIEVDGMDIEESIKGWQKQIGYVPQTIYLTDDTLRNNIAFGLPENQVDDKAIEKAVNDAQLTDFVNELPEGLNTFVGERGARISGGQRQRIGIARALYHNPSLLVLDEATSALDTLTEMEIMRAVNSLKKGSMTILIVAHRLSTLDKCDWIYRFDKGVLVDAGSPDKMITGRTTS
jgi:ABC-type multidrug transport system fused ATPase/permease subunit